MYYEALPRKKYHQQCCPCTTRLCLVQYPLDNRPKKYYLCTQGGPTAPRPLLKTDLTNL